MEFRNILPTELLNPAIGKPLVGVLQGYHRVTYGRLRAIAMRIVASVVDGIVLVEQRGIVDTAERAARWRARSACDLTPLYDGLTVWSEEQDAAYPRRFAEWLAAAEARERGRLGDELYEALGREADAM